MRKRRLSLITSLAVIWIIFGMSQNEKITEETRAKKKIEEVSQSYNLSNDADRINAIRKQLIENACKQLGYTEDNQTTDIRAHISPNHKFLYCRVNKCASTMSLEVLKRIFDCDTDCLVEIATKVKSSMNARKIMNDALSLLVVREPYGRLFSTYSNIFYFPKEDWLYRAVKILKLSRTNMSLESRNFGHDLTFAELIKYTVESYEDGLPLDEHVRPLHHKSCNPCIFHFDYIAHLETLSNDFKNILEKMIQEDIITSYPFDIVLSLKEWTLFGPIKHLFRTLLLVKGSNISRYVMFLRAWNYYKIIGKISKYIKFPLSKVSAENINKDDFIRILKVAMKSSDKDNENLIKQKHEAMIQAYLTVPMEYMHRLRNVIATDCLLFGYDERPDFLFERSKLLLDRDNEFNFFEGL